MTGKTVHHLPLRQTAVALIGEIGSESNAHGVARIVRSRDSRRKVLWSLMVLFGVGAAISQLSSLVHKYLQYQVVEVSEIQDGHPVEFPSVTVCNIEPISWRKLRQLLAAPAGSSDILGWLDFLDHFHFGPQDPHLRSIRAFHENVGRDALYVRHGLNESLLHCSFNKQPCSTANFTTSFDGNYYSCFTFNTQPSDPARRLIVHSTGPEYGLSVVMFLDNNEPPLGSYGLYALDTNILHSAGARVMVHAPNTLPIPVDHGQDVAPGFSTSVSIKPFLHSRLPQPYGNCSDTYLRGLPSFTSTFSTCIAVCKQELIVRTCGCRSSALPELPHAMHVPYCGQVVNWREMLRDKDALNRSQHLPTLACEEITMERLKNDRGYETDCGCTHPCFELSYHMSTSMSYWPLELYQFDALTQLYGDSIVESPLRRAYQLHEKNIKEGEMLNRQMQQQQQQTQPPPVDDPDVMGVVEGEEELWSNEMRLPWRNFSEPSFSFNTTDSSEISDADKLFQGSGSRYSSLKLNESLVNSTSETAANHSQHAGNLNTNYGGKQSKASGGSSGGGPGLNEEPPYRTLDYNRQQMDRLREASTEIRQNLLRLNVYLEDLSVVKYKQMPAYGMEDLFADIGGTLGLWMGVSVLTVMELLELIVRLSHLFLKAEWKPGHKAEENDADDTDAGETERHVNRFESVRDQERMRNEAVRDQDRLRYEPIRDQDRLRYESVRDQERMRYESVREQERMRYEPIRQHDVYSNRDIPPQSDDFLRDENPHRFDYGHRSHIEINGRVSAPEGLLSDEKRNSGRRKLWHFKRAKSKS